MASFWDKFTSTVNELGSKVAEKTTSSAENIKLTTSIKDEERQIANAYQEIGKKYRELFGENPGEEFAFLLEDIAKRELLVSEYRKKIQQNKGKMNCESCGAEIECTADFCAKCGTKNPVAEEIRKAKAEAEAQAKAEAEAKAAAEAAKAAEIANAANKVCVQCGTVIAADNLFCTNCGARQDAPAPVNETPAADAPETPTTEE